MQGNSQEWLVFFVWKGGVMYPVSEAFLRAVQENTWRYYWMGKIKLNPALDIMGILLTKVDRRTNFAKDISAQIREVYGNRVHIFVKNIKL